jgi:hypothetical protein
MQNYLSPEEWELLYPGLDWPLECLKDDTDPSDPFPIYPVSKGMLKLGEDFIEGWETFEGI